MEPMSFDEACEAIERASNAFKKCGISTEQLNKQLEQFNEIIGNPILIKTEMECIKHNPSLNIFQKWIYIRQLKKAIK